MIEYIIQNCQYQFIYHWIVYMIGGFRHLEYKTPPGEKIRIYMPYLKDFGYHNDSLKIISDRFEVISELSPNSTKIEHNGEKPISPDNVDHETYRYLRQLFLSRLLPNNNYIFNPNRKIYLSRKISFYNNLGNGFRKVRHILNEDDIIPLLKDIGFEIVYLEELSFEKKIELFQTAGVIVSSLSGGLTMSLFANEKTKIIEILPNIPDDILKHNHYKNICRVLNITFYRYTNVVVEDGPANFDTAWNMRLVDPKNFIEYISNILI